MRIDHTQPNRWDMTRRFVIIALIALWLPMHVHGQEVEKASRMFLSIGTGFGYVEGSAFHIDSYKQATRAAFNVQVYNVVVRLRGSVVLGDKPNTAGYSAQPAQLAPNNIFEYGLLIGYTFIRRAQWIAIAAGGMAVFDGTEPQFVGNPENRRITNGSKDGKGFATEIGVYYRIGKSQNGLAVVLFSNMNSTRSYGGLTFNWYFGRIYTRD